MTAPGSYIHHDWCFTREAQEIVTPLFNKKQTRRKIYGLLEKPKFRGDVEEVNYKLFVAGKSGVGKTSTICKLTGHDIPTYHCETPGSQKSTVYWPVKLLHTGKIIMFNLHIWDAGENSLKKYDHILHACRDKVDGILFLFSFVDKGSFDELPQYFAKLTNPQDNISKVVIGTKFDQHALSDVTQRDIHDFESNWKVPVLRTRNVPIYQQTDIMNELNEVAPLLNTICETLLYRDVLISQDTVNKDQEQKVYF